jgi:RNA polymerase sigma-70 factor (ECF subfamily)
MKTKNIIHTDLPDEALMDAFVGHRVDKAYSILYQRYFEDLSKYLSWLSYDKDKGKDLAQSVFLKIYQKPELFDLSKNFKVWLFTVAKNQWKNEIRNEAVRLKHQEQFSQMPQATFPTKDLQNEKLKKLNQSLEQLSENHREVFVLKYSNNLTISEISKICNCSV